MVSPVSGWTLVVGALEAEGAERVEQAVRVLEVHVVPGGARLAVAALKEQYFLGDPGGDCRGEAALAGRDAGEALDVGPAGVKDAPEGVAEHLPRKGKVGGDGGAPGPVAEAGEEGRAVGQRAAGRAAFWQWGDTRRPCLAIQWRS